LQAVEEPLRSGTLSSFNNLNLEKKCRERNKNKNKPKDLGCSPVVE
jgi:hypothetical protein